MGLWLRVSRWWTQRHSGIQWKWMWGQRKEPAPRKCQSLYQRTGKKLLWSPVGLQTPGRETHITMCLFSGLLLQIIKNALKTYYETRKKKDKNEVRKGLLFWDVIVMLTDVGKDPRSLMHIVLPFWQIIRIYSFKLQEKYNRENGILTLVKRNERIVASMDSCPCTVYTAFA